VLEDLSLIIGVTMLCMLSPGPDLALVMQSTLAGDRSQGLLTSLGILTGNMVHITYCALGIGYVVAHSVLAYSLLRYAGAAYLIYLGIGGLRSAARPSAESAATRAAAAPLSAYLRGLFNNLLNPKGALFYLGVFTQVIRPGTALPEALLLIAAMLATSALFWVIFVSTLHLPPVRRTLARSRRAVDALFGGLLVALGLRVAAQD
jgi:RhtB (resistance to homoserine/threonine) family protein